MPTGLGRTLVDVDLTVMTCKAWLTLAGVVGSTALTGAVVRTWIRGAEVIYVIGTGRTIVSWKQRKHIF